MTRDLLWRGMLSGALAALLATLFARVFAEPQVDLAIAFEAAQAAHDMAAHAMEEPEIVSRATQKGIGLLTATLLYGTAIGGIFSLVFAYCYGRIGRLGPRTLSLILVAIGFVAIAIVPAIKYPPTPPAVGQHETVALRTAAYFAMLGISIAAAVFATRLRRGLEPRWGAFNALLLACGAFIGLVAIAQFFLPVINEVPANYPATLLWDFRVASIGTQFVLWSALGIAFGLFAERLLRKGAPQL